MKARIQLAGLCVLIFFAAAPAAETALLHFQKISPPAALTPVPISVELARTPQTRAQGLKFRRVLPPASGMLLVFEHERRARMWMQDTPLSLDMIFINAEGVVTEITAHTTPQSTQIIHSREPVRAVLELSAGEAARLGILPGSRLRDLSVLQITR